MKHKVSKDFSVRLAAAEKWRQRERGYISEVLAFICPGREGDFDRKYEAMDDDPETFMSLPEDLAMDFASDLVTYYTPSEVTWTEYMVMVAVEENQVKAVNKVVSEREKDLFQLIQASNYNDVATQIMFEANHGTVAMWVQQGHLSQPMYVESVPPNELLITPGHMGILDRFRQKWMLTQHLPTLFSDDDYDLSDPALQKRISTPGDECHVTWGFWLDWSDPGNPVWKSQVTVDKKAISGIMDIGPYAGSCPLLVGRFNPQTGRPWGRGPGRKALPDMRVLNALDEGVLDGLDQALRNTLIYSDDGFLDLSEGVEPGRAYAASRGFSRDQIYEMQRGTNIDLGHYSQDRLEERMRGAFYQDGPRQRGDTPPTATQVIDERRRVQIRIGKPSAPLFTEFFLPFIQRVEFLGTQAGEFDGPLTHAGDVIKVLPISPLQKAQNLDKVMTARSNLDLGMQTFGPEGFAQVVDPVKTFENVISASGDEITVIREEEETPPDGATPPPQ